MDYLFAIIMVLSLAALVVGLIKPSLVIRWGDQKHKTRGAVTGLCLGLAFTSLILIGVAAPDVEKTEQAQKTAAPVTIAPLSNLTYAQIDRASKKMTELQFDEYAKTLKGKRVEWRGTIVDVEKTMFGDYEVLIDQTGTGIQDVTIEVDKNTAMRLSKDQTIRYTGTIEQTMYTLAMLLITMEDAKVM
ncbi:MAG: hypothetical protein JEY79_11040 [Pseudodesulfovibrio sp.]|nr:hypothetical protein [Pseudodesulfovibrio sp.]